MSVAPTLPPTIMPSPRRPGEAVVIPFPVPRDAPDEPFAVPIPLRARRALRPVEPRPVPADPAMPTRLVVPADPVVPTGLVMPADPAAPAEPGLWLVPPPRRVARPARRPRSVGLRLTRRGRLVLAIAALLALVAFGALGARVVPARSAIPPSAPSVVQVQPGDTLWSIARRVAPDADTRAVVDAIAARNGLVDGALHPGQRLLIRP